VVGDSGGGCFCRRALITLVTPLYRPGSANATTSVCLSREQERPLRCRPIIWPCQTWGCGLPYSGAGRRSCPSVAFPAHISTHAPRRRRPGCCPPFCVPIRPRRRPIVQRHPTGEGDCRPAVQRPIGHCASPVALPCSPLSQPFCNVSGTPPPAVSID